MNNVSRRQFVQTFGLTLIGTTGIAPFLESCTKGKTKTDDVIDFACRLTDSETLLNLEFYFINCSYNGKKIKARYGPHENYMIVRMPQQHIAETAFPPNPESVRATAYIAGYSYLVFRILFPVDEEIAVIELNKDDLLDWGCEEKFRLVVRQDLTQSIFETKKVEYLTGETPKDTLSENSSQPFQKADTIVNANLRDSIRINRVPKVFGDPVTAIELPWRLIISPKLPDSNKYRFHWDLPHTSTETPGQHKLWMVTLSIIERDDNEYIKRKNNEKERLKDTGNEIPNIGIANIIPELELMIMGSLDYPEIKSQTANILPDSTNRKDLVELYIKHKIAARSEKITFSPLGASSHIYLTNDDKTQNQINLLGWDHWISLGRTKKVVAITLGLEADCGHKLLIVKTQSRELSKDGKLTLIKRDYVRCLDISKDYTNHETEHTQGDLISRFYSPFKKITFLDIENKEVKDSSTTSPFTTGDVYFEFEGIDWQENPIKFKKLLNIIPLDSLGDGLANAPISPSADKIKNLNDATNTLNNSVKNFENFREMLLVSNIPEANDLTNALLKYIEQKQSASLPTIIDFFKTEYLSNLTGFNATIDRLMKEFNDKLTILDNNLNVENLQATINETAEIAFNHPEVVTKLKLILQFLDKLKLILQFPDKPRSLLQDFNEKYQAIIDAKNKVEKLAQDIPSLIYLYKQKIAYTAKEEVIEVEKKVQATAKKVKDTVSRLSTEYIIFEGQIRQAFNEAGKFDFFHQFPIIPKLNDARVFVDSLNKLVSEEIPVHIHYASDYINSQIDNTLFQIENNASQVFAEVKEQSRQIIKEKARAIGRQLPGFNLEVPSDYLTLLKQDPKESVDTALKEIAKEINLDISDEIISQAKDLVFLGEDIKKTFDSVVDFAKTDPKLYFKDLSVKLFGSISLEEILGIGFDLPKITLLHDQLIYQFSNTVFQDYSTSFLQFKPNVVEASQLNLLVRKSLQNLDEYHAYTELTNFSIGIRAGGTEVITVEIERFNITSTPAQRQKTDIKIRNVKLGGPLEFVAKLAEKFTTPGEGMRVIPSQNQLDVSYAVTFPDIASPSFNFRNLQLVIGLIIPFDPNSVQPIAFRFGVNRPASKFLVTAGIYGGRGHCLLTATPKGIQTIDVALEMGAYASLNLGIAKGEIYLFFGIWFVFDNAEESVKAVAYVLCSGSATVFGFITIGVSVMIALTYVKRNKQALLYGEAIVSYSVKVAFFKKTFSIRYHKEIAGSSDEEQQPTNIKPQQANVAGFFSFGSDTSAATYSKQFGDIIKNADELEDYYKCFLN